MTMNDNASALKFKTFLKIHRNVSESESEGVKIEESYQQLNKN